MRFLDGIPATRKEELLKQLKAVWTHDSTAIEGNALTLGDTMFVLGYGLTVKGKPLKDQIDVQNHANAVDAVMDLVTRGRLTEDDIFALHRIVINEQSRDIYKPVGAYKREDNGTYWPDENGRSVYHAYLPSDKVPEAIKAWLDEFNGFYRAEATEDEAIEAYVRTHVGFTSIHPFYDGNGRLARLLSNLPVLFAGYPPIVIPVESRQDYLQALWDCERGNTDLSAFRTFIRTCWRTTLDLVAEAKR